MKKSFLSIVFVVFFLAGYNNVGNAETQMYCLGAAVDCGNGIGSMYSACGNDIMEMFREAYEIGEAICGG